MGHLRGYTMNWFNKKQTSGVTHLWILRIQYVDSFCDTVVNFTPLKLCLIILYGVWNSHTGSFVCTVDTVCSIGTNECDGEVENVFGVHISSGKYPLGGGTEIPGCNTIWQAAGLLHTFSRTWNCKTSDDGRTECLVIERVWYAFINSSDGNS